MSNMPRVTVETTEGKRTVEQKKGLVKDITDAVVKHFGVPPTAVTVVIHEIKPGNRAVGGKLITD